MENLSVEQQSEVDSYQVAGPLCNPDDLTARNIKLPVSEVGDLIAITASGAYGPTASPVLFHSQGHPAEVMVLKGKAYLIRHRDEPKDIISRHLKLDFKAILSGDETKALV